MIYFALGKPKIDRDGDDWEVRVHLHWPGKNQLYAVWSYSGTTRDVVRMRAAALHEKIAAGQDHYWLSEVIDLIRQIDGKGVYEYNSNHEYLEDFKAKAEECLKEFGGRCRSLLGRLSKEQS